MSCDLSLTAKTFPFSSILIWRDGPSIIPRCVPRAHGHSVLFIGNDSLVCRRDDGNEHDHHAVAILWKQYCWICPPKYKWLPLETFNVASDIHLCSSIVFTCQSRGWIC